MAPSWVRRSRAFEWGERTMEKTRCLPLLLTLCLLVLLSGCARGTPAADGNAADDVPAVQTAEGPEKELRAVQLELEARPLTEEAVLEAYDRAEEACGWFELSPLSYSGETVTVDGCVYNRVTARGMEDMEDLRTYLRSLFSEELTERLLETGGDRPLYREVEGSLYVIPGGRSRNVYRGAVKAEAEPNGDSGYLVSVSVELLDDDQCSVTGLECWSFPYTCVDGRWVFTDFRLVY